MPNCSFQDARTACINYEAVNELDIQSMKISNTLLSRPDELQSQGQSNLRSFNGESYSRVNMKGVSTRDYKANHKGEMKFGKCLSCGKFHPRNSCALRNAKCFKCGKIGHIQSVCKATVHFASSSTKSCHLNLNSSDVSSYHLSLSTISKGNAHIEKRLYTSLGSFHDIIVDTGSIESIISFKNLKFSDPNVVRDELSITPDGILCLNDCVVIPPSLRKSVLEDLHSGHLGVEKMKSLARLTCWWPEMNADICRTANNCEKRHQLKSHPLKWTPWPVSSEAWQRIHADYSGPFLGKYYALIVIDSFSK
ncbi:unnamed protein product [Schistosoma margrebowiei]|uniref:Uncharacterized protein n=1 Tax=Schistosoma margrebowiei TaxID=48269 RepID=A0A183LZS3_9TREM|nr:unnamed protein product [Schistosoma margrebowiei]